MLEKLNQPIKPPEEPPVEPPKKRRLVKKSLQVAGLVVAALLFLIFSAAAGGYLGYQSALELRYAEEVGVVAKNLAVQFQLGIDDMNAGRYAIAQKRFEWILERNPTFPGLVDQLARVKMVQENLNLTRTPTPTPTFAPPTATPTPDLRGEEELFTQARQNLLNSEWDTAIQTLIVLRNLNLKYKALEVDGIFFIALRYRGVARISNGELEPGMYDLTLAEQFGPLDQYAVGLRSFSRTYLSGASFWEVDWEKSVGYFEQIYKIVPNLRDSSNITASERYRIGLARWGDWLLVRNDPCLAQDKYNLSLTVSWDTAIAEKYNQAEQACIAAQTPTPGPPTETPTPEGGTPASTETPTPTP